MKFLFRGYCWLKPDSTVTDTCRAWFIFEMGFFYHQLLNASKPQSTAAVIFWNTHMYIQKYLPTTSMESLHQLPFRVQIHATGKTNIHLAITVQNLNRCFKLSTFLNNILGVCVPFRYFDADIKHQITFNSLFQAQGFFRA